MPALSISDVRFVRAILDGTKTQTMRPLFDKTFTGNNIEFLKQYGDRVRSVDGQIELIPKKPRLKVSDIVKMYYKQRSTPKGSWFCKKCGRTVLTANPMLSALVCCNSGILLPKHFATVKVTNVFEVELRILVKSVGGSVKIAKFIKTDRSEEDVNEFAKMDGFKSAEEMFNWFHEAYDLKQSKRFAVYRWSLIK